MIISNFREMFVGYAGLNMIKLTRLLKYCLNIEVFLVPKRTNIILSVHTLIVISDMSCDWDREFGHPVS